MITSWKERFFLMTSKDQDFFMRNFRAFLGDSITFDKKDGLKKIVAQKNT